MSVETIILDDVPIMVTFEVNFDRPRDELPEVYDVTLALGECDWLKDAVTDALREIMQKREDAAEAALDEAFRDGPEYDPNEDPTYGNRG